MFSNSAYIAVVLYKYMFNNQHMSSFSKYFYENVALKIRYYREKEGLTQEQLSEFLGKNLKYIGHIERAEKNITLKNIEKIAKSLNIDIKDLFDFSNLK